MRLQSKNNLHNRNTTYSHVSADRYCNSFRINSVARLDQRYRIATKCLLKRRAGPARDPQRHLCSRRIPWTSTHHKTSAVQFLRNHGYDPSAEPHTRIPGIWEKLSRLYNLEAIDERENSFDGEEDNIVEKYLEFSLPEEEFHDMMWVRGKAASDAPSSPPQLHEPPKKRRKRGDRASTVDDTDDARSSPAPQSTSKATPRPTRGGRRASGRIKADGQERLASKDTTTDHEEEEENEEESFNEEEAEEQEEDGETEEEEEDGEQEEENESEEEEENSKSTAAKATRGGARGRGRGRGQSTRGGRGGGRGRGARGRGK
jgi:hypothetical protein